MTKAEQIEKIIFDGTPAERRYLFELSPKHFAFYYFTQYYSYDPAPFHNDMWEDMMLLDNLEVNEVMWKMFRESAKTSIHQIKLIHGICYNKFKWHNWSSYDKGNAENALFDIAIELQTNDRLRADYGDLYNGGLQKTKEKSRNRLDDFITNEVKDKDGKVVIEKKRFTAYSTQQSWRGRKWRNQRPDSATFDDFETEKTKESRAITDAIIANIDAAKAGMAPNAKRTYLCNAISDVGSVAHLTNMLKNNPKAIVRDIGVLDKDGNITWPSKYVHTDIEAFESHTDPNKRKVSLETKKRELDNYESEMLNNPVSMEDLFFNRVKVDAALQHVRPPTEISAGLYIFEDFKPLCRYAIGADVSEGTGRDHSTSVVIDFQHGEVVASFMDNKITPDRLGDELVRQARMYGNCLIAPERNSVGIATVIRLEDLGANQFIDQKQGQIGDPTTKKYGWRTTKESKSNMLFQLKQAFESGALKIYDERILNEMRNYARADFLETTSLVTNHFDLVIALAIAWAMREHATVSAEYDESSEWNDDYVVNSSR